MSEFRHKSTPCKREYGENRERAERLVDSTDDRASLVRIGIGGILRISLSPQRALFAITGNPAKTHADKRSPL